MTPGLSLALKLWWLQHLARWSALQEILGGKDTFGRKDTMGAKSGQSNWHINLRVDESGLPNPGGCD
ncbi:hypothetical protein CJA_3562 [Cellvibrio japonicus Ueda107]|uniref:Uncharacterized protein n=1 Tax=Cellvibrio japonicus (strain Ueda107) TaxID=498211 RepID=B3PGW7_CELJU|nr:hypothetical protein CJA_3562 [Cellvibrio japonicus Ueda107]